MEKIGYIENKIKQAKEENWKIRNIIRDCGKFEDLCQKTQEQMVGWIEENIGYKNKERWN